MMAADGFMGALLCLLTNLWACSVTSIDLAPQWIWPMYSVLQPFPLLFFVASGLSSLLVLLSLMRFSYRRSLTCPLSII
jgi:hypothetical protein